MTLFALDAIPRTLSRSQACDVLSSMANIAGYRAVRYASEFTAPKGCGQLEEVPFGLLSLY